MRSISLTFGGVIGQLDDLVAISKRFTGVIVLTLGSEGSIAIQKRQDHTAAGFADRQSRRYYRLRGRVSGRIFGGIF